MTETLEIIIGVLLIGYGLKAWRNTPRQRHLRNRRTLRRSMLGPRH